MEPHTPTIKHIAGQAAYQLAVMYGLIFYAPSLLGIPGGLTVSFTRVVGSPGCGGELPLACTPACTPAPLGAPHAGTHAPRQHAHPSPAADHATVAGPSEHYTMVFNTFVFMQASRCPPLLTPAYCQPAQRGAAQCCRPPTPHWTAAACPPFPLKRQPSLLLLCPGPQLFNQLNARKILDTSLAWEGLANAKWFQARGAPLLPSCLGPWFAIL